MGVDTESRDEGRHPAPVSRKESQAQTRERLIAVGRKHFLRDGLAGAVAEKIAAEAGYTRGALYANFNGKEELFVAVVQAARDEANARMWAILRDEGSLEQRFERMRERFADLVTNPDWVVLQTEFQTHALRREPVRLEFLEQQRRRREDGAALLKEAAEQGLKLSGTPEEVVAVLSSLSEGLALRQAISRETDTARVKELAVLCFDRMIST